MLIVSYLFSSFLCFFSDFSLGKKRRARRFVLVLSFFSFFFPLALRHELVGIDTHAYYRIFDIVSYAEAPFSDLRYESGFVALNLIVQFFGGTAEHLIFVAAFLSLLPFFYVIGKYSVSYLSSFAIMCGVGSYGFMFNGVRQAVAMGLILLSFHAMVKGRYWVSVLLVFLASLFHFTALLFLIAFFLNKVRVGFPWAFLAWIVSLLFISSTFSSYAFGLLSSWGPSRYSSFLQSGVVEGGFRLRFLTDQVFCILFLYFIYVRKRFSFDDVGLALLYISFFGFLLNNVFMHMGYIGRLSLYFTSFSFLALPYLASFVFNRRSFMVFVALVYVVFTFFYFRGLGLGANGMMPYFTVWG